MKKAFGKGSHGTSAARRLSQKRIRAADVRIPSQHSGSHLDTQSKPLAAMLAQAEINSALIAQLSQQLQSINKTVFDLNERIKSSDSVKNPFLEDANLSYSQVELYSSSIAGQHCDAFAKYLVIPLHSPKVAHLSSIFSAMDVSSYEPGKVLLSLVTTTSADRIFVEQYIALTGLILPVAYEVICATDICHALGWADLERAILENRGGGIINMKKFLGIYRAFCRGAQQICCIDIDVIFKKNPDVVFDIVGKNYAEKKFVATFSPSEITQGVVRSCIDYFRKSDASALEEAYEGGLYSWFFDVPTYMADDLSKFFAYIRSIHGGLETALGRLTWHHFDHVLYINFLLLKEGFTLIDARPMVRSSTITDGLNFRELKAIEQQCHYVPAWATLASLAEESHSAEGNDYSIIYHVDRN